MSRLGLMPSESAIRNSVFNEISKNFRCTLRAAKRVMGDRHALTTACLHACTFPTDRMSLRMVWEQFEALPVNKRAEVLLVLRTSAF
jgi:hypothetical protein